MAFLGTISCNTAGKGLYDLSKQVQNLLPADADGLCHLFIQHTSASLVITENADPTVHLDLENFMSRLVADGDPSYQHTAEGPDDMSAHIRSVLTKSELNIPVQDGRLMLGVWQGVYLWEHRSHAKKRSVACTLIA
ncbi:MAG: YjbQ family protein [Gammaproteobacteria bacterium]|nr:YjbQ family protein [Gammaproteobacteria bacterium]